MKKKKAIVLGATGLTGRLLVEELINDLRYSEIKLFSRRTIGFEHPVLKEFIIDVLDLERYSSFFIADEVYCCIGTTKAKNADPKVYHNIDYGIPVAAAKLCKENNINTIAIISAIGANKDSAFFYNKTKGEMEEKIRVQKIKNTYILRPSILTGKRTESRFWERFASAIFSFFVIFMQGPLKKYRPISARSVIDAMLILVNMNYPSGTYESDKINLAAKKYGRNRAKIPS